MSLSPEIDCGMLQLKSKERTSLYCGLSGVPKTHLVNFKGPLDSSELGGSAGLDGELSMLCRS